MSVLVYHDSIHAHTKVIGKGGEKKNQKKTLSLPRGTFSKLTQSQLPW